MSASLADTNNKQTRWASRSSLDTLSSIKSAQSNLPQYSPLDSSKPSVFSTTESEWEADNIGSCSESATMRRGLEQSSPGLNGLHLPLEERSSIPPRYSRIFHSPLSLPTAGPDDGGPKKVTHIEHAFPIRNTKPWATLLSFTNNSIPGMAAAGCVRKIPHFVGNDMVTGMVELDLKNTQIIQEISVTLRGKLVTGYLVSEEYTFLEHKHVIWNTKSMGHPPTSKHLEENQDERKKTPGIPPGSYQIPFSFPFPALINFDSYEAVLPDRVSPFSLASLSSTTSSSHSIAWAGKKPVDSPTNSPLSTRHAECSKCFHGGQSILCQSSTNRTESCRNNDSVFPAPPTFLEPGITASTQYELSMHIVHGFLKPDNRIKTAVSYAPSIVPHPPSALRREAYAARNIAPGPLIDPQGWFALPKVTIEGRLGGPKGRDISVLCQLYLATPLTYTRDTFIPCYLSFSADDAEALNILASPNAPCVRLVRRLRHFCPKGKDSLFERNYIGNTTSNPEFGITIAWSAPLPAAARPSGKGASLKTVVTDMGGAVWWKPPKDSPSDLHTSNLEGEIHLPVDMQPSSACPIFQIEYFVEMQPPTATAFEFKHKNYGREVDKQILVSHPVRIATFYPCDGIVPIAFTQPLRRKR